jgi:hypothetical protein
MYSNFSNGIAKKGLIMMTVLTTFQPIMAAEIPVLKSAALSSNQSSFSAQPSNCIALRHGRTCYANVTLSWYTPLKQDYCLYIKQSQIKKQQLPALKCWKNSNGNQIVFNFESNKKIEFQLLSSIDKRVVAEAVVEVSWVHKATPRKRRWRIF